MSFVLDTFRLVGLVETEWALTDQNQYRSQIVNINNKTCPFFEGLPAGWAGLYSNQEYAFFAL